MSIWTGSFFLFHIDFRLMEIDVSSAIWDHLYVKRQGGLSYGDFWGKSKSNVNWPAKVLKTVYHVSGQNEVTKC